MIATQEEAKSQTLRSTGAHSWALGEGSLRVKRPAPGVVVFEFGGKMMPEFVPKIRAAAEEALRHDGSVALFFDTEKMSTYHPEFRRQMTSWHEELKDVTRSAGVLIRSRIIGMAIAVANLVTGGKLEAFSNRSAFEAAIKKAMYKS